MRFALILGIMLTGCIGCSPRNGLISTMCGAALVVDDHPYPASMQYASFRPEDQLLWTQEDLDNAETTAIVHLNDLPTLMSGDHLCNRLRTVTIIQEPNSVWIDPWRRDVAGMTECDLSRIYIGTGPYRDNAYAHELAHLAQNCNSPLPIDEHLDYDHSNWNRDGIYDAIFLSQGYVRSIH